MLTEDQIRLKLEREGRSVKSIVTEEKPDGEVTGYSVVIETPIGDRVVLLNASGEPTGSQG